METVIEKKEKRQYKKFDMGVNEIAQLMNEKKISFTQLSKELNVGEGTAKKYVREPLLMNGIQRKIISGLFEMTCAEISALIDR